MPLHGHPRKDAPLESADESLILAEYKRRQSIRDTSKQAWRSRLDFSLDPQQIPLSESTATNKLLVKGRRFGGTTWLARDALKFVLETEPGCSQLWVDTVHRNVDRYVKRYFLPCLRSMPKKYWSWNAMKLCLSFAPEVGGGWIDFGSAQHPELMEGFGYRRILLNEAGIILRDSSLYFNTLLPMGDHPKGTLWIFVGAPKGKNLFHKLALQGKNPEQYPGWMTFHGTSYDNARIPRETIEEWKRDMPEPVFRQEILAEFIDEVQGYFRGVDGIVEGEAEPPQPNQSYIIGVDLARSQDFTVCWVGCPATRRGVHMERWRKLPWEVQEDRIMRLAALYNNAYCIIDATGLGSGPVESLQRKGLSVVPVVFNLASKMDILSGLAIDIEQRNLTIYAEDVTVEELKDYEMIQLPGGGHRLSAPPGQHDDCVIALALMRYGFGAQDAEYVMVPSLRQSARNDEAKYN